MVSTHARHNRESQRRVFQPIHKYNLKMSTWSARLSKVDHCSEDDVKLSDEMSDPICLIANILIATVTYK
jgi:hypothetical protein